MLELDPRGVVKVQPLADWSDEDVKGYLFAHDVPYNPLHDQGFPVDRLHPLHPRGPPGRGLARRPLGGRGEDRVRAAPARRRTPHHRTADIDRGAAPEEGG